MTEPTQQNDQTMTTYYGTRHKLGSCSPWVLDRDGERYRLLVAACSSAAVAYSHRQGRSTKICTRCFPDFTIIEQP